MKKLIIVVLATIIALVIPTQIKPIHDGIGQPKNEIAVIEPLSKLTTPTEPLQPVETPKPSITPKPVEKPPEPVKIASGGKLDWLRASGIPESDWVYVDYIISKESSWNPQAKNSSSGAGGLPQALPYSKTGCAWGDAVCQLKWANGYAVGRYGSWAAAHSYWARNHWW